VKRMSREGSTGAMIVVASVAKKRRSKFFDWNCVDEGDDV